MIKSEVINKVDQAINYPCLMSDTNVVALFENHENAIVVFRLNEMAAKIGKIIHPSHISNYKIFEGEIKLSNLHVAKNTIT